MKRVVTLGDISSELRSRSVARKIFSDLAARYGNCDHFELDFKDVSMISRSFADEIYEFINLIGKTKVTVKNTATNISLTLEIVDRNRSSKRHFDITGETKCFNDIESLKKYLLTI